MKIRIFAILFTALIFAGCSAGDISVPLNEKEAAAAKAAGADISSIEILKGKDLYKFSPEEVDQYLKFLQAYEPDLRNRIIHLAKKNLGQPYQIYLLGEYPFEIYDDQPLYCIDKSDCVVFSEHIYAMALSGNWKQFFTMLQRIRYKDGIISYMTRNHYTEADWDINNSWLITEITNDLVKDKAVKTTTKINRAAFFKKYGIGQSVPVETINWTYIAPQDVAGVIGQLQSGDFVNVVRGFGGEGDAYVGHVGLISKEPDGTINFIHSTEPQVKEQTLLSYMNYSLELTAKRKIQNQEADQKNQEIMKYNKELREKNGGVKHPDEKPLIRKEPYFYGFRFFRLNDNPMENLKKTDGPNAPRITIYGNNLY
ncbi:MAG: DUF1460 domain-containing protein [Ignavibacteriaceae bacterium]|nr:DUF1460 domain-containing protein [Ignavibacteriaceae bacterium]